VKRAANQPTTSELALYAGIYCKTWHVPDADTVLPQHSHDFPHLSYIVSGSVRVYRGGDYAGEFTAPASIRIPARQAHTFQTLVPNVTILCIHNADRAEPDGEPPIHAEHHIIVED